MAFSFILFKNANWALEFTCEWQDHSALSNKYHPRVKSNPADNKNKLWKTVRRKSFEKPQLQSVSIFFKFIHSCRLLYFRCYLYLLMLSCYVFRCGCWAYSHSVCFLFQSVNGTLLTRTSNLTLLNSNQSRFPPGFPSYIFCNLTVVNSNEPSITRTSR